MSDHSQIPDKIRAKFPFLRPVKGAPSLMTMNGIGLGVYGRRDFDDETQTYIKTRCVCVFFIPLFAVDAFRVADAGSRTWFFFGKESLSPFAKMWNLAMVCAVLLGGLAIGWNVHTSSPEYKAQEEINRAAAAMQAGEPLKAAQIYQQQIHGPQATAARQGLHDSVEACLKSDQARIVATAFRIVVALPAGTRTEVVSDPFQSGLALTEKFRPTDADGALDILAATAKLDPTNSVIKPLQVSLLKESIAANPDHTNRVVELAVVYEADDQLDESVKLLRPYQHKLGATEGARILGQHLLSEGKSEDAYGLLFPYVQTRLEKLRGIEGIYTNAIASAYQRALEELNTGNATGFSYDNYERAAKPAKEEMVDNFIQLRMHTDAGLLSAQEALKEANKIVPVTLDLGIVQLNRAQSLQDPPARKTELEAAEKTFLAIQGFAGETDEYRMFLGQVYYWLGKPREGKELFDQLLAAKKRAYPILISLSGTLREVGEEEQARQLCEEAYAAGKKGSDKYAAASLRARIQKDNDDEIAWLEKADPNEPDIQISLNDSRGQKALRNGNRELAAQFFRKAVAGYDSLRRTPATLNNHGLACINLYGVTGDIADHDRGLKLIEEAIALVPGNSVLVVNTTHLMLTRGYMDVVGDAIRFNAIKNTPDRDMLKYLYTNEAERLRVYQRLQDDPYFKKAASYLDKALLLAPKRAHLYQLGVSVQNSFRNLPELQRLEQRFLTASPDVAEIVNDTKDYYAGVKSAERLRLLQSESQRYETLLNSAEIRNHPLSLEFVRVELNSFRLQLANLGAAVDGKKLLDDARLAYEAHQDAATLDGLINAHLFKAHQELSRQSPAYAEHAKQTQRSLSARVLIAALIERNNALSKLIQKNQDVLKAVDLVKEHGKRFPTFQPMSDWALLTSLNRAEADAVGRQLNGDPAARLADQLEFRLNPFSATAVLEQYWTHKMRGDEKRAVEIYQTALNNGVPLPAL